MIHDQKVVLTPPLGWNSWNCYGETITQEKIKIQAEAMINSRLKDHGFVYINIDDGWQGDRGGLYNAIQGNSKFPDMQGLCDYVHDLGLKIGIYSTPWCKSYAGYTGGCNHIVFSLSNSAPMSKGDIGPNMQICGELQEISKTHGIAFPKSDLIRVNGKNLRARDIGMILT